MASHETVVIVGAGQAGSQTAASLRELGHAGPVVLIGDEPHPPYQRPPLSKAYVTGDGGRTELWLRADSFFADNEIDLRFPESVASVDRAAGIVHLESGERLAYDHLVLALGGRNRPLDLPGSDLDGVVALRSLGDADDVRTRLSAARNVVVVGGGFIGLEVAATSVRLGRTTTVLELADQLMGRVLSPPTADALLEAHRRRGMTIELCASAVEVHGEEGRLVAVSTQDGRRFPADLLLVGIGATPNVELAAGAGLAVDNGIVVDEYLVTSDPCISAVGDCASFPSSFARDKRIRLESVQNAVAQPRCVAARITGSPEPFWSVPWFWSDQADLKVQIAGLPLGHDEVVVRGDPSAERFSAWCFGGGELLGVESLNRPAEHMAVRRAFERGRQLSADQVRADDFDLKGWASGKDR